MYTSGKMLGLKQNMLEKQQHEGNSITANQNLIRQHSKFATTLLAMATLGLLVVLALVHQHLYWRLHQLQLQLQQLRAR